MFRMLSARYVALAIALGVVACKPAADPAVAATSKSASTVSADLQIALNTAVADGNLGLAESLLKKGAQPDKRVGDARDALTTAGELVRQNQNKESIWPPLRTFMLLRKHVRHRDTKIEDVRGELEIALVSGAQQGVAYAQLSVRLPDGTTHPIDISASETSYFNAFPDGRQFVVRFGVPYRLIGTMHKGNLEVEELHLVEPASSAVQASSPQPKAAGGAMAIPLPLFLPSTNEALTPYLS